MNETKSGLIVFTFAIIPYVAVAWGYAHFAGDGSRREFWIALGVLLAVRLFFSVIETLGGVLAWRLYHKKRMVTAIVQVLRANKFPPKQRETDSFSAYLARIVRDYEPKPDFLRAGQGIRSHDYPHVRIRIVNRMEV
jgi:hypothetical protein